jgi:hypothetical protein
MAVHTFDHLYSPLGVLEVHAGVQHVSLPDHSGDIDLFLVVGGTDDNVREMVGRAHIQDIMINSCKNPMNALMSDGTPCRLCGCETPRTYYGRCTKCTTKRIDTSPYTYAAKHVVSYTVGCFDIQFITRIYKDADLIVPRFDMTVDGAIFSPKMGLRVLPIALQEWRNGIFILSPFSGSSTMNERVHKKMERYDIVPVIPGYVEDLSRRGVVYSITAARTIVPGIRWRALIAACKKLPMEYRESVVSLWHYNVCTKGLLKRIRTVELLKKHLLDDDIESGGSMDEYNFSRADECSTYNIPDTCVSILTDRQGSCGSSGSFQALTVEETMLQLSFQSKPPKIEISREPSPTDDDVAAVTIPAGNMDMATLKKVKRGLSAFTYESQPVFLNNLFMNKSALSVTGLSYVLIGTSGQSNTLEIAIVGDNFLHGQHSRMGAQVWTVRVRSITDAPALMCTSKTGLYQKGVYVCMGAQSHFHEATDPLAVGIQFSLLALIVSITDRAKLLMDRDVEHVGSVGVLEELHIDEAVVKHHQLAYADLCDNTHEWVYKIEL